MLLVLILSPKLSFVCVVVRTRSDPRQSLSVYNQNVTTHNFPASNNIMEYSLMAYMAALFGPRVDDRCPVFVESVHAEQYAWFGGGCRVCLV
jgi:hypothetical protein